MLFKILFVWVVLISLTYGQAPLLPPNFVAKLQGASGIFPGATINSAVEYSTDYNALRVDRQFTYSDEIAYQTVIIREDPIIFTNSYSFTYDFFGTPLDYPLCVYGAIEIPPFSDPILTSNIMNATINGLPVQVWKTFDDASWWYLVQEDGIFVPFASFSFFTNEFYSFNEVDLERPSPDDFEPPGCYDLGGSIHTGFRPKLPPSYTLTAKFGGGRSITTSINAQFNASSERKTFMGVGGVPFSWTIVKINGTSFAYTDFFPNITPYPCFASYGTVFQWPDFSKAGNEQIGANNYNLFFGSDHRLWVFNNQTTPIAAMSPDLPLTTFTGFSPKPPPGSAFTLPSKCFVGNPNGGKRSVNAFPQLPPAYTLYVTYYDTFGETSGKMNIYYDMANGFARLDTPFKTYIQRGRNLYSMINPLLPGVAGITPLPCYGLINQSYSIWENPSFEAFLANVTVSSKPVKVLLDDRLDTDIISFWYLTYPDNTPLYFVAATTFNVVDYYAVGPPPSGIFDIPATCVPLTSSQQSLKRSFNVFETLSAKKK